MGNQLQKTTGEYTLVEDTAEDTVATATQSATGTSEWSLQVLDGQGCSAEEDQKFVQVIGVVWNGDQLVVCDRGQHTVFSFKNERNGVTKISSLQFTQFANNFRPWDVAVLFDCYFIVDDGNLQIIVCNQNSELLGLFSLTEDMNPSGIAVTGKYFVVTDLKGNRVLKYTTYGKLLAEIGGNGFGDTEFRMPVAVVVNSKGLIIVSDNCNSCIKFFDSDLNFKFLYKGRGKDALSYPSGIDLDSDDNVYVCDSAHGRIVKLTADGKFDSCLFEGELNWPYCVAVRDADDDGVCTIAVTERSTNQIKLFSK